MNKDDKTPQSTAPKNIPIEDILAYKAKGLKVTEIANLTGCTHSAISQRLADIDIDSLMNFNKYKDQVLEHKQREVLNELTDAKVKSMTGLQLITGAAILEDKIRIIRGQATDIQDVRVLSVDLDKAVKRLREARGGGGEAGGVD